MSRICPECGRRDEDAEQCASDGAQLLDLQPDLPFADGLIAKRFPAVRKLGSGGMGSVFLAINRELRHLVAIKLIAPEMLGDADAVLRFRREAQNLCRIRNSPNVVRVFDLHDSEGQLAIVMEFVDGTPLLKLIEEVAGEVRQLDVRRALTLVKQVAAGLAAVHEVSVVHRDLKPANIMVTRDREGKEIAKLVDFGLAKSPRSQRQDLTQAGVFAGTPEYSSPEQALGEACLVQSDVFSLGLIAFELLTGSLPLRREGTPQEVLIARLTDNPATLKDLVPTIAWPARVQEVFDKALARNPENRHDTAVHFAEDLDRGFAQGRLTPAALGSADTVPRLWSVQSTSPIAIERPVPSAPGVTRPRLEHGVDLWTPGESHDLIVKSYEPLLGLATAESLSRLSKSAIRAVADGDFARQIAIADELRRLAPVSEQLQAEALYLEAEGLRLLSDLEANGDRKAALQARATELYAHCADLLPGDPRPIRGLGRTREVQGDLGGAERDFELAFGLCVAGMARERGVNRLDLAHEALRTSRHRIHCLLSLRQTNPASIWNREHKTRELEGLLISCENLHREYMPQFASERAWSCIEWFMGLVFIAQSWKQLGNAPKAQQVLVHALIARRQLIGGEGQLSEVERANIHWWLAVATDRLTLFGSASAELLTRLGETESRSDALAIIDEILLPYVPPWGAPDSSTSPT